MPSVAGAVANCAMGLYSGSPSASVYRASVISQRLSSAVASSAPTYGNTQAHATIPAVNMIKMTVVNVSVIRGAYGRIVDFAEA